MTEAKRKAHRIGCLSNLRQAGMALHMWVDDNNGWLPPGEKSAYGLWTGQRPAYQETTGYKYDLAYYLSTYLRYPAPDSQLRIAKVFFCPGFERYGSKVTNIANRTVYVRTMPSLNRLTFDPFGYPPADGDPPEPPHRLIQIQSERPLADVWFLADADQVAITNLANTWQSQLPDKPVHGKLRNYLYFDNHVATRKLGKPGSFY